jgi:predicted nuclease with TOPRIM domain
MMIFQTVRKYATLIKWGGIILVVGGILYAVYDYSQTKEQLGQMEDNNIILEDRLETIKDDIDKQTQRITSIRADYTKIELAYSAQIEQIQELRDLTTEYITNNRPQVEQQLNLKFSELQQNIECVTGDQSKCALE